MCHYFCTSYVVNGKLPQGLVATLIFFSFNDLVENELTNKKVSIAHKENRVGYDELSFFPYIMSSNKKINSA